MPKIPFWIFIIIAALYFLAIPVDTMDVDASQYAEMSREMSRSSNPLFLYDRGTDYLDKPPFLFWMSSLSIKIFGVSNFGFKLPSILFAIWALWATYRLGRILYNEKTSRLAALILGTCQGMFLMTNDIRTDTILMSWVITALWCIKEWEVNKKIKWLVWGSAAIAFGMMTKGPIALLVPVFCFGSDWILKRKWKQFLRGEYFLAVLVIAVLLIPMSVGLYQQFDLHPEKMVNGTTNVSGLRFFYWSQSFGRITGESPWDNGAPFSFLYENMLWSFLPWIVIFTLAFILQFIKIIQQRFKLLEHQEALTLGGFLLAYISLAMSNYQLPHYIFVVFPLVALMTAKLLDEFWENKYQTLFKILVPVQYFIGAALLIAVFLSFYYVFKTENWMVWLLLWLLFTGVWLWVCFHKKIKAKIIWVSALAIMMANVFMSLHFYPQLLKYQAGSQLGRYIHEQLPGEKIYVYQPEDPLNALFFYADKIIPTIHFLKADSYIITMEKGLETIQNSAVNYTTIREGDYFKISQLTLPFLNPDTRKEVTKKYYLLKLD